MGYSSHKKLKGESHLRLLRRTGSYFVGSTWAGPTPNLEHRIIALQPGRCGVYGIIRVTDSSTGTEYQFGLVIKVESIGGDTLYKAMAEMDGPVLAHMPEKLFRRLTPVDQLPLPERDRSNCTAWRARCQQLIDTRNALRGGVRFTVAEGVSFGPGRLITEFQVIDPRSRLFLANPGTAAEFRAKLSLDAVDELEFEVHGCCLG
jgi:hypothetical protein